MRIYWQGSQSQGKRRCSGCSRQGGGAVSGGHAALWGAAGPSASHGGFEGWGPWAREVEREWVLDWDRLGIVGTVGCFVGIAEGPVGTQEGLFVTAHDLVEGFDRSVGCLTEIVGDLAETVGVLAEAVGGPVGTVGRFAEIVGDLAGTVGGLVGTDDCFAS